MALHTELPIYRTGVRLLSLAAQVRVGELESDMTRAQIIEELRRSAREDQRPWIGVDADAWMPAITGLTVPDHWIDHSEDDVAMYFLIVACALEDES